MSVGGLVWGLLGNPGIGKSKRKEKSAEGEAGKGDDEPSLWLRVLTVYTPAEAQIAAARLRDEGIPVRLSQEAASSALPVTVGMLGQIHILVPEMLLERAELVLEETMDFPVIEDSDDDDSFPLY
jgi:hypothetical protein